MNRELYLLGHMEKAVRKCVNGALREDLSDQTVFRSLVAARDRAQESGTLIADPLRHINGAPGNRNIVYDAIGVQAVMRSLAALAEEDSDMGQALRDRNITSDVISSAAQTVFDIKDAKRIG